MRVSDAEGRYQRTRLTANATFSYPPAAVKSIEPRTVPTEGDWVMIIGNGFGASENNSYLTGLIGDQRCTKTIWISSKKVRCLVPPGVGKNVSVAVYLGRGILTAAKKILSYRHPVVHKIEPNHAPGSGDNMTVVAWRF